MAFNRVRLRCFLLCLLLALDFYPTASQQQLRRSLLFNHETSSEVDCLYHRSDVQFEDGQTLREDVCEVDGELYNLPKGLLEAYESELYSGLTRIHIKPATLQGNANIDEANHIVITPTSTTTIHNGFLAERVRVKKVKTMGRIKVIAVRVTSKDANVTLTRDEISNSMFGNPVSLASQMNACSAGALTLLPGVPGGVGDLEIDVNTQGVASKNLEMLLRTEFIKKFGSEDQFDHILYCMPKGTSSNFNNWIAYAYRETKFSYYNDIWAGSLTSKLHEIGHNMVRIFVVCCNAARFTIV